MKSKSFAMLSAKGGVGKTLVTINLAIAVSKFLNKTALAIDANLEAPTLALYLGIRDKISLTLDKALRSNLKLHECAYFHAKSGIAIIPGSLTEIVETNLNALPGKMREMENYDCVFVDTRGGVGEDTKQIISACDEVLIITNPWVPIIAANLKIMKVVKELDKPIRGVVLNKTQRSELEMTKKEVEEALDLPVIASIPVDQKIYDSIEKRSPFLIEFPDSKAAKEFKKLAEILIK